ncbi:MAG: hypothetical protein IJ514_01925 [Clostridia bacterium]|nr:hypothetical protein [Clostridia bacterium]
MTREERKAKREEKKRKKAEELDTETTVADMNVEGFSWYDPNKKKNAGQPVKVTRKEYWAMVRGAFAAMLPVLGCIVAGGLLVALLAYTWLS